MIDLVLGGARSGKSQFAEQQVRNSSLQPIYIATAQALDNEMVSRISHHQNSRSAQPVNWITIEEPIALAHCLTKVTNEHVVLVDCLTLWLTNCLLHEDPKCWQKQRLKFLNSIETCPAHLILVSNEVGHGIVPLGEMNRQFVDETGWLHQAIAKNATSVHFIMAGCSLKLK